MKLNQLYNLYLKYAGEVVDFPTCQGFGENDPETGEVPSECKSGLKSIKKRPSGKFQCDECYQADENGIHPESHMIPRGNPLYYPDEMERKIATYNTHVDFTINLLWEHIKRHVNHWSHFRKPVDIDYLFNDCSVTLLTSVVYTDKPDDSKQRTFQVEISLDNRQTDDSGDSLKGKPISDNRLNLYNRGIVLLLIKEGFNCEIHDQYFGKHIVATKEVDEPSE